MSIWDRINPIKQAQAALQLWGGARQQGQLGHTGSWGTRDWGLSELAQGKLVSPVYAAEGDVLGAATPRRGGASGSWEAPAPSGETSTGGVQRGGPTGGGPTEGGEGGGPSDYFVPQPQGPSMEEIENAYNQTMGVLGGMETQAGTSYGTTKAGIESGAKEAATKLRTRKETEFAKLAEGQRAAEAGAKSQISKARKLYGDLKRSELARLSALGLRGGSTAQATMELLGRETAGQIGGARQELQNVLNSIQQESRRVEKWLTDQLTSLEEKKNIALREAKDKFDLRLQQIGLMKAEAGQAKAQRRMDALEQFRQDTMRINEFNSQMAFKLEQWGVEKKLALEEAARQAAKVPSYGFRASEIKPVLGGLPLAGVQGTRYGGYYIPTYERKEEEGTVLTPEEEKLLSNL